MKMIQLNERNNLSLLKTIVPSKEKLCIATQAGQNIIPKVDILYLRADSNYCVINYNNTKLICSQTLKSIESRLHLPRFMKVHKSYVVNFEKIKFIDNAITTIVMEDGTEVPIARAKKQLVKAMISKQFD